MAELLCRGCGHRIDDAAPTPFSCPEREAQPGLDHVLVRHLSDDEEARWPTFHDAANPFVLYRGRWRASAIARDRGLSDAALVELIEELDDKVARTWGCGFRVTPLQRAPESLAAALGCGPDALWLKDETGNVSGSHKARHLFGVLIHLEIAARVLGYEERPPLAIASCGNAALAAGVLARAASWPISVFIPPDAAPAVVSKLRDLGAELHVMPRDGQAGDPCYRGFQRALAEGALPFCCQGPDNGLCVEGGQTLGYELVDQLREANTDLDALFVQVGGGALASACVSSFVEAERSGRISRLPRLYTVQTTGAAPLARAYERLLARFPAAARPQAAAAIDEALGHAAAHRHEYMWPWEETPASVAHGILDDETYDWLAVLEGLLRSGGAPLVVSEARLREAQQQIADHSEIAADHTGTAGLAGWIEARARGLMGDHERSAVLLTGRRR